MGGGLGETNRINKVGKTNTKSGRQALLHKGLKHSNSKEKSSAKATSPSHLILNNNVGGMNSA